MAGALATAGEARASGLPYRPHGGVKQMMMGNGLVENASYNANPQTGPVRLGTTANPATGRGVSRDIPSGMYEGVRRSSSSAQIAAATYACNDATTTCHVHDGSGNSMAEYGGTSSGTVKMRFDYTPFGEQIAEYACMDAEPTRKFTGKERDAETNSDYFGPATTGRVMGGSGARILGGGGRGNDQRAGRGRRGVNGIGEEGR